MRQLPPIEFMAPAAPDNAEGVVGARLYVVREDPAPGDDVDRPWKVRLAHIGFAARDPSTDRVLGCYRSPAEAKSSIRIAAEGLFALFDAAWPREDAEQSSHEPAGLAGKRASRFLPPAHVAAPVVIVTPLDEPDDAEDDDPELTALLTAPAPKEVKADVEPLPPGAPKRRRDFPGL